MGNVLLLVEPDDESESLPLFIEHISVTRSGAVVNGPLFVNLSPHGIDNCDFGWGEGIVMLWLVI
jgi:hypothetical protein